MREEAGIRNSEETFRLAVSDSLSMVEAILYVLLGVLLSASPCSAY